MATYYWVGGSGTWNGSSKTNWATISGGAGGNGPPTSADIVNFDSASGTGTCTTAAGSACATATLNSSTLGLTLGANHTMSSNFTLTAGTLSLGSYTLSCNAFNANNSNTRSVAFGTGNITLTGSGTTIWNIGSATGWTITGTPVVNCTYAGSTGTRTIVNTSAITEPYQVSFNVSAGSDIVAATTGFKSLDFTGFSGTLSNGARTVYGNLIISSGMTCTAGASAITFAATSGTQQITTNANATIDFPITFNGVGGTVQLQDNMTVGSTRTVTLTAGTLDLNGKTLSCGLFSSSNSNTRTLAFGASGVLSLTGSSAVIFTISSSTNLTITGSKTVNATYNGSTGTRTVNGSSAISESNAINFNVTAGSDSLSLQNKFLNLNLTGFSGTLTNNTRTIYYNFTIPSDVTCTDGAFITTLAGTTGTSTITTNGVSLLFPITVDGVGGTFVFNDALTLGSDKAFTFTNGTVKFKSGTTNTVGSFVTSGTNQKYLQSTTAGSQATLSQASGTVNASYLTIKDINVTGGATWNAYIGSINAGNNTGWKFILSVTKKVFINIFNSVFRPIFNQ